MNIERDRKWSPFSLLSDTPQRSSGLIRHYCVYQRAHTRVHSCEIQAQCPSKQPTSLPCKIPTLFPGSTTSLNIGLVFRMNHGRVLRCFPDPLLAWTFYYSSDSLSTELQGHCIAREIWMHPVHQPSSSSLFQPYSSTSRSPSLHELYPLTSASPASTGFAHGAFLTTS